ncbi:carboxypeptidase-like regulatory domain-containing protein, partial [bacterium]|nr:carboxypeptidase-like regulatory domain-containing protein [bacterium]
MRRILQLVRPALITVLIALCLTSTASAGVTGRLKGKVVDKNSQEALPNALVKIEGTYFETTTNSAGEFSIIGIDAGTYSVSAQ